jgi:hypothetical protein
VGAAQIVGEIGMEVGEIGMDNKFDGLDFGVAACSWIVCLIFATTQVACLKVNSCGGGDMFLFGIIAVGMLAPAWVTMLIFSSVIRNKE